ncbi:MAG: hypothetical protein ACRC10_10325 [Thermoguttaceae bacterium]
MSTSETLSSLAILKASINEGNDYHNQYLRPFIEQILHDDTPSIVRDADISQTLEIRYGIIIPPQVVQLILKRLVRSGVLIRNHGVYSLAKTPDDKGIANKKADADRQISSVVKGLIDFSKKHNHPIESDEKAKELFCLFLSDFSIQCISSFCRGTAIPEINSGSKNVELVLVSKYIFEIQNNFTERFDSFMVLVQGHMLANGLMCDDIQNMGGNFRDVVFYIDTPLVIQILGLDGTEKQQSICQLITALQNLHGRVAIFSHTQTEVENVIRRSAKFIDCRDGRGGIVNHARKKHLSMADIILKAEKLDELLKEKNIVIKPSPNYEREFQIDESIFSDILQDEVHYHADSKQAINYDINSVRSVMVIRKGISPTRVENSKAILITSNSKFAYAAYKYVKDNEFAGGKDLSCVMTDFSIANIAWLKQPVESSIPRSEIISHAYSAFQPTAAFLNRVLKEVDKLDASNTFSERDHAILRSHLVGDELMDMTLGNEDALSGETISDALARVTEEIQRETKAKLDSETENHDKTKEQFKQLQGEQANTKERIRLSCDKWAKIYSYLVLVTITAVLGFIIFFSSCNFFGIIWSGIITVILGIGGFCGFSYSSLRQNCNSFFYQYLLKNEKLKTELDL